MNLFRTFSGMVEQLPPESFFAFVEKQQRMIEEDLIHKRLFPIEDTISILKFCRFFEAKATGRSILPSILLPEHVAFYRRIVERLVEAGELPPYALHEFDAKFPVRFSDEPRVAA